MITQLLIISNYDYSCELHISNILVILKTARKIYINMFACFYYIIFTILRTLCIHYVDEYRPYLTIINCIHNFLSELDTGKSIKGLRLVFMHEIKIIITHVILFYRLRSMYIPISTFIIYLF